MISAVCAFQEWDGESDPGYGWNRHIRSGRRRPDGTEKSEYIPDGG